MKFVGIAELIVIYDAKIVDYKQVIFLHVVSARVELVIATQESVKIHKTKQNRLLSPLGTGGRRMSICDFKKIDIAEGSNTWECSECESVFYFEEGMPHENHFYYCPNCGLKIAREIWCNE